MGTQIRKAVTIIGTKPELLLKTLKENLRRRSDINIFNVTYHGNENTTELRKSIRDIPQGNSTLNINFIDCKGMSYENARTNSLQHTYRHHNTNRSYIVREGVVVKNKKVWGYYSGFMNTNPKFKMLTCMTKENTKNINTSYSKMGQAESKHTSHEGFKELLSCYKKPYTSSEILTDMIREGERIEVIK